MLPLRNTVPTRTCTKIYKKYTFYKPYLREDFGMRCGYCNDRDVICGGTRGFHIDHFRPRKYFAHLENDYNNLVYTCPYCNGGKKDDWPSGIEELSVLDGRGYIDPCDKDFDNHFERHPNGQIRPKTNIGSYMFERLKLGLRRHELAWKYEQLENLLFQLIEELENFSGNPSIKNQLDDHCRGITKEYLKYKKMFEETL
ncbi:MAG: HNH endonuclease [Anaerolineae bacterium]|nr:HNH endonuclease [Anaerolineae bacterium]